MHEAARHSAFRSVMYATVSGLVFLALARAAIAWGGDLLPIPLWLATASAVAIGLFGGRNTWPAVFVGAGLVGNVFSGLWLFDETLRSLLVPGTSVAVELVIAWLLLGPLIHTDQGIRRTRQAMSLVGRFIVIAVTGASIAAIDTSSAVISSRVDAWEQWAFGEFVGLLVVIPLVVAHRSPWLIEMTSKRRAEAAVQVVAAVGFTVLSFSIEVPVLYVVIAIVCWISIRFGLRLSAPVALVVVVLATSLSGTGAGPFFAGGLDPVVQVQIFNAAVAVVALVVSAHATRASDDQQQLAAILRALPDAAAVRSQVTGIRASWIPPALEHLEDSLALHAPPRLSTDPVSTAEAGSVTPTELISVNGNILEHRISPVDDESDLHLFRDVTEISRARRDVKMARERLHFSEAAERQRLGRALHDGPIQDLSALQIRLGLEAYAAPESLAESRMVTQDLLQSTIETLRSAASTLQPPELGDRSLGSELSQVAERLLGPTGVAFEVIDQVDRPLGRDDANTLFLVGREAVANVAFHAGASSAVIDLREVAGAVELRVTDDGVGMSDALTFGGMHFGLALMKERMEGVGGSLILSAGSDGGTEVTARLAAESHPPN